MHVEAESALLHAQKRPPGSDLNVVRMRAKAEDRQPISRRRELQRFHGAALLSIFGCCRQGVWPRSTISSRICLSLSVSIARQKPSYLYAINFSALISRLNDSSTSSSPILI